MKSAVLIILDGWGISPIKEGNATLAAKTPFLWKLLGSYPKITLSASSEEVGLPYGEMGNSEVGHLNIGTGRVAMQDLPRINQAISSGSFYQNEALLGAIEHVRKKRSCLHFFGLVSAGGVHSHIDHLFALLKLARKEKMENFTIQMIADGRDTPAKAAYQYLARLEKEPVASVSGRYYAMDRDKHWDRTEKVFNLVTKGEGEKAESLRQALDNAYQRGETDEFIKPTRIADLALISDNDAVVFFNFRADRARQISEMLTSGLKNLFFVSFTSYGREPNPFCKVAFFTEKIEAQLAKVLEENELSQLHIAESEKYAHITYFFNGGREEPFLKEKRILIPSPKVSTYDLKPEMSAMGIAQRAAVELPGYDFTVVNFANADMVGHTGDFQATIQGLKAVDQSLFYLINHCLKAQKTVLVTADHGNAESMKNPQTGEINKEHTTNPVFLIIVSPERKKTDKEMSKEGLLKLASVPPTGILADVAPTILDLMGIEKPKEMTGMSLREECV